MPYKMRKLYDPSHGYNVTQEQFLNNFFSQLSFPAFALAENVEIKPATTRLWQVFLVRRCLLVIFISLTLFSNSNLHT